MVAAPVAAVAAVAQGPGSPQAHGRALPVLAPWEMESHLPNKPAFSCRARPAGPRVAADTLLLSPAPSRDPAPAILGLGAPSAWRPPMPGLEGRGRGAHVTAGSRGGGAGPSRRRRRRSGSGESRSRAGAGRGRDGDRTGGGPGLRAAAAATSTTTASEVSTGGCGRLRSCRPFVPVGGPGRAAGGGRGARPLTAP